MTREPLGVRPLSRSESLRLLGSVSLGRIAFTHNAVPVIRPVNHLLDGGNIIVRTHHGSMLTPVVRDGAAVAYEADEIDPHRHVGWSVIVTGRVGPVTSPDDIARFKERLHSWVEGEKDFIIRIEPAFVTGLRLVSPSEGPG